MVKPRSGWTEKGDEYRIVGGKSYVKEEHDGSYYIILYEKANRIRRDYAVPAKDLTIDDLVKKLEGPFNKTEDGSFGKDFLDKFGKPLGTPSRLSPE